MWKANLVIFSGLGFESGNVWRARSRPSHRSKRTGSTRVNLSCGRSGTNGLTLIFQNYVENILKSRARLIRPAVTFKHITGLHSVKIRNNFRIVLCLMPAYNISSAIDHREINKKIIQYLSYDFAPTWDMSLCVCLVCQKLSGANGPRANQHGDTKTGWHKHQGKQNAGWQVLQVIRVYTYMRKRIGPMRILNVFK